MANDPVDPTNESRVTAWTRFRTGALGALVGGLMGCGLPVGVCIATFPWPWGWGILIVWAVAAIGSSGGIVLGAVAGAIWPKTSPFTSALAALSGWFCAATVWNNFNSLASLWVQVFGFSAVSAGVLALLAWLYSVMLSRRASQPAGST